MSNKRKILVSRAGLTRCSGCGAHIKVASELRETACPFCGSALSAAAAAPSSSRGPLSRALSAGRSGLLAASLLGATALGATACSEEEPDPEPDMASDTGVTPLYGEPADISGDGDMVAQDSVDPTTQPLYGEPADIEEDTAAEDMAVPLYGEPADVQDDQVDQADDVGAEPLYGAVPADVVDDTDAG